MPVTVTVHHAYEWVRVHQRQLGTNLWVVGFNDWVQCLAVAAENTRRQYQPLRDYPRLYREFGSLPGQPETIKAFAERYGLLGVGRDVTDSEGRAVHAESIEIWNDEIRAMYGVLVRTDAIRQGFVKGSLAHHLIDSASHEKASSEIDPNEAQKHRVQDLRDWLLRTLNDRLRQHVFTQVVEEGGRRRFVQEPTTLLGALWLQCGRAIISERDFRQCQYCRKTFEVATALTGRKKRRPDARFCPGNVCRAKFHQARKFEARRRKRREGQPIWQIADEMNVPAARVQKWLEEQRPIRMSKSRSQRKNAGGRPPKRLLRRHRAARREKG
jgi:hypothetical protein